MPDTGILPDTCNKDVTIRSADQRERISPTTS